MKIGVIFTPYFVYNEIQLTRFFPRTKSSVNQGVGVFNIEIHQPLTSKVYTHILMQLRKEDALDDSTLYFIGKSLFCSFGDMLLQEALLWTANLEQK